MKDPAGARWIREAGPWHTRGALGAPPGAWRRLRPRPPPAHWWPRQGRGEVAGSVPLARPPGRTRRPRAISHARSPRSMLRAAALAAAGLGPRLGRRLLSGAATHGVPAPNQQPEVFYNQVRPPAWPGSAGALFFAGYGARWARRPWGLSVPQFTQLGLEGFAAVGICAHLLFLPCRHFGPLRRLWQTPFHHPTATLVIYGFSSVRAAAAPALGVPFSPASSSAFRPLSCPCVNVAPSPSPTQRTSLQVPLCGSFRLFFGSLSEKEKQRQQKAFSVQSSPRRFHCWEWGKGGEPSHPPNPPAVPAFPGAGSL